MFGGYHPLMILSIVIGVVQILYAMCINVVKISIQLGFKYAMSNLAWVVLLIASMVTFGLPALGVTLSVPLTYGLYGLLGLAVLIIVFYNSPGKNVFINVGSAIWDTYNMASGLLGDTLSYVRLFALGLTGSILGSVFNSMAFGMTEAMPGWIRWLAVLLILLVGHGLNIALNVIGALVHPLRLTFVEFYKNAGFEGGGKAYNPFRKSAQTS
jgi:V/A-type H+-transporting ATPase subunit I